MRYVLEGSVQPSGDRMRVNAQLIDAGSGAHLWAEQFDTPRADLLQTQDAIVAHLTNTLDLQLQQACNANQTLNPSSQRALGDNYSPYNPIEYAQTSGSYGGGHGGR